MRLEEKLKLATNLVRHAREQVVIVMGGFDAYDFYGCESELEFRTLQIAKDLHRRIFREYLSTNVQLKGGTR